VRTRAGKDAVFVPDRAINAVRLACRKGINGNSSHNSAAPCPVINVTSPASVAGVAAWPVTKAAADRGWRCAPGAGGISAGLLATSR
jgi:hypothetical protein